MNNSSSEAQWEVRPSGMLVQRRDDSVSDNHHHQDAAPSTFGSTIEISVSHGSGQHVLHIPPVSTFGDLRKILAQETGLVPADQKLLFRGQEKDDTEQLHTAGLKNKSKVILMEDTTNKETEVQQPTENPEMAKALSAIASIRAEVDRLSERVAALEVAVNSETKVAAEEFDMSAELLMRQLLKLDGIEADGEARLQRKAEVLRVQKFHETLDNLKARNSNPSTRDNAVSVTTEWETFDSGVGSLNPQPPSSSSTKVTQDWEQFD